MRFGREEVGGGGTVQPPFTALSAAARGAGQTAQVVNALKRTVSVRAHAR